MSAQLDPDVVNPRSRHISPCRLLSSDAIAQVKRSLVVCNLLGIVQRNIPNHGPEVEQGRQCKMRCLLCFVIVSNGWGRAWLGPVSEQSIPYPVQYPSFPGWQLPAGAANPIQKFCEQPRSFQKYGDVSLALQMCARTLLFRGRAYLLCVALLLASGRVHSVH